MGRDSAWRTVGGRRLVIARPPIRLAGDPGISTSGILSRTFRAAPADFEGAFLGVGLL